MIVFLQKGDSGSIFQGSTRRTVLSGNLDTLPRTTALAIKLMVSTGLCVGELTQIKLSNISNDGYRIRIHGEGSKERNVYIGNSELRAELQHIKCQAHRIEHDGDYLLLNKQRRRLTEQAPR